MKNLIQKINAFTLTSPRLLIFLLAFTYVILAGLFIQLVFLPFIAPPGMSAGDGLLSGYDGYKFHRIAVNATQKIIESGWAAWSIRPENQIVSGIASFFYVLLTPKPWVLLPLNGFLHGIASIALYELIVLFTKVRKIALLSVFPFILFPSFLLWNAQIHNENYTIPGVLILLFGWIYLADIERGTNLKKSWMGILCVIIGSFIEWAVRDYIMTILQLLVLVAILLVVLIQTIRFLKQKILFRKLMIYVGLIAFTWLLSSPFFFETIDPGFFYRDKLSEASSSFDFNEESATYTFKTQKWERTAFILSIVDDNLYELSKTRAKFIRAWSYAGSQIDTNIKLESAIDIIKYIPRALEIGFLAPFPSDWFTGGYKKAASLMRMESAFEMIFIYLCLPGLFYSYWRFRNTIEIWSLSVITIGMIIIYTIAVPNVGSLYRFRVAYLMPLVCLGLSGIIHLFQIKLLHHRKG